MSRGTFDSLTIVHIRIVDQLILGKSNHEIASALGVKTPSVKKILTKIYKTFGVRNRSELIVCITARDYKRWREIGSRYS